MGGGGGGMIVECIPCVNFTQGMHSTFYRVHINITYMQQLHGSCISKSCGQLNWQSQSVHCKIDVQLHVFIAKYNIKLIVA